MEKHQLEESYSLPEDKKHAIDTDLYSIIDNDGMPKNESLIDLPEKHLKNMYEKMVQLRLLDDKGLKLQRQGRIGFYVSSLGSEATHIGTAYSLKKEDWISPYYRQQGVLLLRGYDLKTMVANWFGNELDAVKGRQMPIHYTAKELNFISVSSPIGTQLPHAVGVAMAAKIKKDPVVVLAYMGDGATSSDGFHAAMNMAGVANAPVVFICINNQYAISTPISKQTASDTMAIKGKAYGIHSELVDGNDVIAVYHKTKMAVDKARRGEGPSFIECYTYRLSGHSSSDDPGKYRGKSEETYWETKDPIVRFRKYLEYKGLWNQSYEKKLLEKFTKEINTAVEEMEKVNPPAWETLFDDVYEEIPQNLINQRTKLMKEEGGLKIDFQGEFPL